MNAKLHALRQWLWSWVRPFLCVVFAMCCVVWVGWLLGFGFSAGSGYAGGLVKIIINDNRHGTP